MVRLKMSKNLSAQTVAVKNITLAPLPNLYIDRKLRIGQDDVNEVAYGEEQPTVGVLWAKLRLTNCAVPTFFCAAKLA